MLREYKEAVDDSSPGRFECEGPMTAYAWGRLLNGDQGDDDVDFGDCDGATRFGRRIVFCQSNGFISLTKYESLLDACEVMDALHDQFDVADEDVEVMA